MKPIALLAIFVISCVPSNTSPAPDASDASIALMADGAPAGDEAMQVCAHLAAIGCAQPVTCVSTYRANQRVRTDFKPACLLSAPSASAASSCGTITCH